jgi:hypothetical protein
VLANGILDVSSPLTLTLPVTFNSVTLNELVLGVYVNVGTLVILIACTPRPPTKTG